jgi:hypothetical protein
MSEEKKDYKMRFKDVNWKRISTVAFVILGISIPLSLMGGFYLGNSIDSCGQTTKLSFEIDQNFYIIDIQDDPEYENRTAKILGMEMVFMLFDYDAIVSILNYLAEDNCLNVTDKEEIKEVTGMEDFVSGITDIYWLPNFIFFDEPIDDIRGNSEIIEQNFYIIPYFILFFEWNGTLEEVLFTFDDIQSFFDSMSGDIICEEDFEGVHILHGCTNNFVFKGVEWDSIDSENSTVSVSYNGETLEMIYSNAFPF